MAGLAINGVYQRINQVCTEKTILGSRFDQKRTDYGQSLTWVCFSFLAGSNKPFALHGLHVTFLPKSQNIDAEVLSKWGVFRKTEAITKLAKYSERELQDRSI